MTHLDEALTRIYHNKVGEGAANRGIARILGAFHRLRRGIRRAIRRL